MALRASSPQMAARPPAAADERDELAASCVEHRPPPQPAEAQPRYAGDDHEQDFARPCCHRIADHDPLDFEVVVREGKGETRHHVTMSREMCERLTAGKHTPERCLEAAFRFLLDREPKESILGRFDATVISRYFPEFERELPRYLSRS